MNEGYFCSTMQLSVRLARHRNVRKSQRLDALFQRNVVILVNIFQVSVQMKYPESISDRI